MGYLMGCLMGRLMGQLIVLLLGCLRLYFCFSFLIQYQERNTFFLIANQVMNFNHNMFKPFPPSFDSHVAPSSMVVVPTGVPVKGGAI